MNMREHYTDYSVVSTASTFIIIRILKGKFFPVYAMKSCRMSGGLTPLILNLSTK
jgi:hypothetical protein